MKGRSAWVAFAVGFFALGVAPVVGQTEANFGSPSASAPDDLVALQYLVGEWVVRSFERDSTNRFVESAYTSSYRARYLYDGLSILAEFYGDDRDGFYGVHVITSDSARGLIHSYFNARADRRIEFTGSHRDGEYHLTRDGGYGGGDFTYRETDSEISESSFVKRIYESRDGGDTWEEGDYYFRFERVSRERDGPVVGVHEREAPERARREN